MLSCQIVRHVVLNSAPIITLSISTAALGQTWTGGGTGTIANPITGVGGWNAAGNWAAPAAIPLSANTTALIFNNGNGNPVYFSTNNVPTPPFNLNRITLNNSSALNKPVINGTALNFQIDPAGPTAPSITTSGLGTFRFGNPISFGGTTLTFNGAGNGLAQLEGVLSGNGSIAVASTGSGGVNLWGNNNYAGGTTLTSGTLAINHATSPLGTGTLTIAGGTLTTNKDGNNVTISNAVNITGNFIFGSAPLNRTLTITGATTLSGGVVRSIDVKSALAGAILKLGTVGQSAAGGGINKLGNGVLQINGDSTYTGATTVAAGTLIHRGSVGSVTNRSGKMTATGHDAVLVLGSANNKWARLANVIQTKDGSKLVVGHSPATYGVDGPGVTLDPGTFLEMSIDGNTPGNDPGNHGQLTLEASNPFSDCALDITDSTLISDLTYVPSNSDKIFLILNDNTDPIIGQFTQGNTITLQSSADSLFYQFDISYEGNWLGSPSSSSVTGGNDLVLYNATMVPEPAALSMLALGGVMLLRRR